MEAAQGVLTDATVTKLEGQILGTLAELQDKPLKLKRAMSQVFNNTPPAVWSKLHATVTKVVEQIVTVAAAKKAKAGSTVKRSSNDIPN